MPLPGAGPDPRNESGAFGASVATRTRAADARLRACLIGSISSRLSSFAPFV
jgi:hypothetical protein